MSKPLSLAAVLAALALQAVAQNALEIIPLRHRTVEQVLPALRPLLEPGGTLTGQSSQLIVRTSPRNLAEIRQALAAIDRPSRRLQISVRFDDAAQASDRSIETDARVSNRGARVDVRARDNHSSASERVDQRIQVLEGGRALIMTGRSTPVPGGVWETGSGFEAVARLAGGTVHVDIAPQKESLDRQQRMATTVSAPLGEWFEVGGAVSSAARQDRGIASGSRMRSSETRRVWLKVEELRP
ncbi:MAG: secretin N-terminal domain-containing protein [Burkholderiales bacterium]